MALKFNRVKPGELITAQLMNSVFDALENMDARVGTVGPGPVTSGPLTIIGVSPQPVTMGTNLTVIGANFGRPTDNVITVGGKTVDPIKISSAGTNTSLIFEVPAVPGLPSDGSAWLTISNPTSGFAQWKIFLVGGSAPSLSGDLKVKYTQPPPDKLDPGVHVFVFTIHAETTLADTYNLTATVDQPGWSVNLTTMDGKALSALPIPQSPSPGIDLYIQANVTVPIGVAGTTAYLTVSVTSQSKPTFTAFQTLSLPAGGAAPAPQSVDVSLDPVIPVFPPTDGGINPTTKGLEIKVAGKDVNVIFQATTKKTTTYTITGPTIEGVASSKWHPNLNMSSPKLISTAGVSNQINTTLRADPGAAPATLVLTVTADNDPTDTGTLKLQIALVTS